MTPEHTCQLHFGAQAGCPERGGSPGLVGLHVLSAVLKSFDVEQGTGPLLPGSRAAAVISLPSAPKRTCFLSTCVT